MAFIMRLFSRLRLLLAGRDIEKETREFLDIFSREGTNEEIQAAAEEYWRSITR
jgi:hypothetical protein